MVHIIFLLYLRNHRIRVKNSYVDPTINASWIHNETSYFISSNVRQQKIVIPTPKVMFANITSKRMIHSIAQTSDGIPWNYVPHRDKPYLILTFVTRMYCQYVKWSVGSGCSLRRDRVIMFQPRVMLTFMEMPKSMVEEISTPEECDNLLRDAEKSPADKVRFHTQITLK